MGLYSLRQPQNGLVWKAALVSLTLLANVYELQGRAELSKETARRSRIRIESTLNQRPDDAEVLGVGAATLVYLGENARAVEWAGLAVALEPSNHTVRYNSACAYTVVGKTDAGLGTPRVHTFAGAQSAWVALENH